jgi:hypothetical protein
MTAENKSGELLQVPVWRRGISRDFRQRRSRTEKLGETAKLAVGERSEVLAEVAEGANSIRLPQAVEVLNAMPPRTRRSSVEKRSESGRSEKTSVEGRRSFCGSLSGYFGSVVSTGSLFACCLSTIQPWT